MAKGYGVEIGDFALIAGVGAIAYLAYTLIKKPLDTLNQAAQDVVNPLTAASNAATGAISNIPSVIGQIGTGIGNIGTGIGNLLNPTPYNPVNIPQTFQQLGAMAASNSTNHQINPTPSYNPPTTPTPITTHNLMTNPSQTPSPAQYLGKEFTMTPSQIQSQGITIPSNVQQSSSLALGQALRTGVGVVYNYGSPIVTGVSQAYKTQGIPVYQPTTHSYTFTPYH